MNAAVLMPVASTAVATTAAAISWRLAPATGWRDQRCFAMAAATSAGFTTCSALSNGGAPAAWLPAITAAALAFSALQALAWLAYVDAWLGLEPGPPERWLRAGLAGAAALAALPRLSMDGAVHALDLAPLGLHYVWTGTSGFGDLVAAASLLAAFAVVARLALAWRRGHRRAWVPALAMGCFTLMGLHDALVVAGLRAGPFLLDFGFVLPVVAVADSMVQRLRRDAGELQGLRTRLEALVADRTRALARSTEALAHVERLAALGHLAAGVAHDVNGPAAVVGSNLRFVQEGLEGGAPPAELQEALGEAREAMARITHLVRQLADAGRLAAVHEGDAALMEDVARVAIQEVETRFGPRIRWTPRCEAGLRAAAPAQLLHDVLVALLVDAGEALPEETGAEVLVECGLGPDGAVRLAVGGGRGGPALTAARAVAARHGWALDLGTCAAGQPQLRLDLPLAMA